ncbi:hypothetical protein RRG08_028277 [Elysia crispata]|uniref:Uncharacterized protein n=1 Tax=Elysia crispata TaxID=231223 RepID=A0AAE1E684_9GAST|nr:hypothetical protein RRG08_028277 [Elysia crispata]
MPQSPSMPVSSNKPGWLPSLMTRRPRIDRMCGGDHRPEPPSLSECHRKLRFYTGSSSALEAFPVLLIACLLGRNSELTELEKGDNLKAPKGTGD